MEWKPTPVFLPGEFHGQRSLVGYSMGDCKESSITMNKASGDDGIPAEQFQTLKNDAGKVLHSICQQIWKTQQWPQGWKN